MPKVNSTEFIVIIIFDEKEIPGFNYSDDRLGVGRPSPEGPDAQGVL